MRGLSKFIKKHYNSVTFFAGIATMFALVFSICTYNGKQETGNETINYFNGDIYGDNYAGNVSINQYVINKSEDLTDTYNLESAISSETANINNVEIQLLSLAKQKFEDGDYMEALRIYSDPSLKDNVYAKINQAYFYAHGYGVTKDFETALQLYEAIEDNDDARRNRLALIIFMNRGDHAYDEEIIEEINYFIDIQDYDVMNYVSLCKYDKMAILLTPEENLEITIPDIYQYIVVDIKYTTTPNPYCYGFIIPEYKGAVSGASADYRYTTIYYHYVFKSLRYLDWLDCLYPRN